MASPVEFLLEEIASSPFLLAPERAEELSEIIECHQIRIRVDQNPQRFNVVVDPAKAKIRFGIAGLERLWCFAHGYSAAMIAFADAGNTQNVLNLKANPRLRQAMELMASAWSSNMSEEVFVWPSSGPFPEPDPKDDLMILSNEMCLMMMGWILLHETGHIVLKHGAFVAAIGKEQEHEADEWATNWVLKKWQEYQGLDFRIFGKRSVAIAAALAEISSLEIYEGLRGGETHPDPLQRLCRFLETHVPERDDAPKTYEYGWFVAITILKLHMDRKGILLPGDGTYEDHRDCLRMMLLTIDKHRSI